MGQLKQLHIAHAELADARAWARATDLTFPTDQALLDAYYSALEPQSLLHAFTLDLMRELNVSPEEIQLDQAA